MAILETQGLKKYFGGVHAVDGVSLRFEEGKMYRITIKCLGKL